MRTVAFFNNKGGVGKTTLAYHLAWMFATHGVTVLAADLDPQANLSAMFMDDDSLLQLWESGQQTSIAAALHPLIAHADEILEPYVERPHPRLGLLPGHLALSTFEDLLSQNWSKCLGADEGAFRVTTAFHSLIAKAARAVGAELVLIDLGPNLGAINRAAMIAAHHVVLPLAPDMYSLQGMKNFGPTLRQWRQQWKSRRGPCPSATTLDVPSGDMAPAGYVVMQHSVRASRPAMADPRWLDRIPSTYRHSVLDEHSIEVPSLEADPHRLALLKHYRSLMPLAVAAHKPMFSLKPADGAIGAHVEAVRACHDDFYRLAQRLATITGLALA